MKVINARTKTLEKLPIALGEAGSLSTGRHLERVEVSTRPGQAPEGPEAVGYFVFGEGNHRHCVLTKPNPKQTGVMVVFRTRGCYTRGANSGYATLEVGDAEKLVSGSWAEGAAGRLGGGSDTLWHVRGPSLFSVYLSGGSRKGYGGFWVAIIRGESSGCMTDEALARIVACDEDPDIVELVRRGVADGKLTSKAIIAAVEAADALEEIDFSPPEEGFHHYTSAEDIRHQLESFGLIVPPAWQGGGVAIENNTVMPGPHRVVMWHAAPRGGKRYQVSEVRTSGALEVISRDGLALVTGPEWSIEWEDFKDGELFDSNRIDPTGWHNSRSTRKWDGSYVYHEPAEQVTAPARQAKTGQPQETGGLTHNPFGKLFE